MLPWCMNSFQIRVLQSSFEDVSIHFMCHCMFYRELKMTSLRPRPVTATVTKPSWMQPEAIVGPRSDSPESRGSTASLTSVLEHESCESLSEDDIDREVELQRKKEEQKKMEKRVLKAKDPNQNLNMNNINTYGKEKKVMRKKVLR